MASSSSYEPLIPSSTHRNPILSCKVFSLTLSVASLICLATIISPFGRTGSDSRLVEPSPAPTLPVQTLIQQSLVKLAAAGAAAAKSRGQLNGVGEQSAVDDCVELLDLSRDRLLDSAVAIASGAHADARTWLSAVLTNHDTCLDGLNGPSTRPVRVQLEALMGLGSATLSALNAGNHATAEAVKKFQFPSWVAAKDRRLLGARGRLGEIEADVVVAKDGSGNYSTVQEAVDSAPDKGKRRYVIYVKSGTYQENVMVGKKKINVMIVGDGMNSTVITGSRNYIDGSTTFNSSTLAAVGDGFILQDICIENTAGPEKHQAVALRVGADRSVINRCQLNGYQDTLYAHSLRQFYRDSNISGTIDFIFGNAAVVFQNCTLIARLPMSNQQNLVTAQGRIDPNQNTGTTIQNCRVVPSPELVPMEGSIPSYLGRPWKNFSRTVYMESFIDGHIDPKGWKEWDGDFALETLYYGEYANWGPGAGLAGRVNWTGYHVITDPSVAMEFTVEEMIQGAEWLSESGVAFTEGL